MWFSDGKYGFIIHWLIRGKLIQLYLELFDSEFFVRVQLCN